MAYIDAEARQELLDTLAQAIDEVGYVVRSPGSAWGLVMRPIHE